MSEHAERTQFAFTEATVAERLAEPVEHERMAPRFIVTGIVVSYAIVIAPLVACYLKVKGSI